MDRTLLHNTYKHLTTLSSAALVLLATYLSDFTNEIVDGEWGVILMVLSIACFIASLLGSVSSMFDLATDKEFKGNEVSSKASELGFLFGMIFLLLVSLSTINYDPIKAKLLFLSTQTNSASIA